MSPTTILYVDDHEPALALDAREGFLAQMRQLDDAGTNAQDEAGTNARLSDE